MVDPACYVPLEPEGRSMNRTHRLRPSLLREPALMIAAVAIGSLLAGCSNDDVGRCCRAIDGAENVVIPMPVQTENGLQNAIRRDPNFACDFLTCVAYQGTSAYCTKDCIDDSDCPDGFECRTVLQSDPGPSSQIQIDDRFCVREAHQCTD